jgi:hypothetical protein
MGFLSAGNLPFEHCGSTSHHLPDGTAANCFIRGIGRPRPVSTRDEVTV